MTSSCARVFIHCADDRFAFFVLPNVFVVHRDHPSAEDARLTMKMKRSVQHDVIISHLISASIDLLAIHVFE